VAINLVGHVGAQGAVQTVGAVNAVLATYSPPNTTNCMLFGWVIAVDNAAGANSAARYFAALIERHGGGAPTITGTVAGIFSRSVAALATFAATFVVAGNNIDVQVTGVAAFTLNWSGYITIVRENS
jgi:hypothetical protein